MLGCRCILDPMRRPPPPPPSAAAVRRLQAQRRALDTLSRVVGRGVEVNATRSRRGTGSHQTDRRVAPQSEQSAHFCVSESKYQPRSEEIPSFFARTHVPLISAQFLLSCTLIPLRLSVAIFVFVFRCPVHVSHPPSSALGLLSFRR
jgi:hypothetical protein